MYILFAGLDYEESGGAKDIYFVGTTFESCKRKIKEAVTLLGLHGDHVWYHIYDVIENKIVLDGEE